MGLIPINKFKSLRFQIGFAVCVILVPICILLVYGNAYATKVVRNQVAASNNNLVTLYMQQIDQNLMEADKFIYGMAATDNDLLNLDVSSTDNSQIYYKAKIRLDARLSGEILNYRQIDNFFVYSIRNDDLLTTQSKESSPEVYIRVQTELQQLLQEQKRLEEECLKQWCVRPMADQHYLLHVVKVGNVYIGAWSNAQRLIVPMRLINFGDTGAAVLATNDFEPMTNRAFIRDAGIQFYMDDSHYQMSGTKAEYMIVGTRSEMGDFRLFAVTPGNEILENLPFLKRVIMIILIGSGLTILMFLYMLRILILKPLNRILAAMRRIREGNWNWKISTVSATHEFEMMNATFNSMITEIQKLKIDVYEEQILKQQAELKHMQLQINPHFFLNALNIVYHLAKAKDYRLIEEMSLSLVDYFRFMFKSNAAFVALEDELHHVRSYLKIQEMRFPGFIRCEIAVASDLREIKIPPLLIQTFVENTIKHALTTVHATRISIQAERTGKDEVRIRIADTGPGFSEEVLEQLRQGNNMATEQGERIGIWNARRRVSLLYGPRAVIQFFNGEEPHGGAIVEIRLPFTNDAEQEVHHV